MRVHSSIAFRERDNFSTHTTMTKSFQGNYTGVAAAFKDPETEIEYVLLTPDMKTLEVMAAKLRENEVDQAKCNRARIVAA